MWKELSISVHSMVVEHVAHMWIDAGSSPNSVGNCLRFQMM